MSASAEGYPQCDVCGVQTHEVNDKGECFGCYCRRQERARDAALEAAREAE